MENQENKQHHWAGFEDDVRCIDCDARYGGKWHRLPCGATEEEQ